MRHCTLVVKSSSKLFETLHKAFDSCMPPSRQSFITISRRRTSSLILVSVQRLQTLVWLQRTSRGCRGHPTGKQLRPPVRIVPVHSLTRGFYCTTGWLQSTSWANQSTTVLVISIPSVRSMQLSVILCCLVVHVLNVSSPLLWRH